MPTGTRSYLYEAFERAARHERVTAGDRRAPYEGPLMSWHVAYADRYETRVADMAADGPFCVDGLGLIDVAGLQLDALYGGCSHEPLTDASTEYVFVVRR